MQMHQIRYFLALCEERNFTRAARRCGVSQPSLTNAIIGLERELGGALFQRKPLIALTVLGHAIHPYLDRIAQNAEHAREAAQALADVPSANSEPRTADEIARSPLSPSSGSRPRDCGAQAILPTGKGRASRLCPPLRF
jgi:DNA-binding transcriptional LysR family regulator